MHSVEKKIALLEDTVKHFSEDPQRRCFDPIDGVCTYSPNLETNSLSSGCAIGRLLSDELRKQFDDQFGSLDVRGFRKLPTEIKGYGLKLLVELQNLHDIKEHWTIDSLTEKGLYKVEQIKKMIRTKQI